VGKGFRSYRHARIVAMALYTLVGDVQEIPLVGEKELPLVGEAQDSPPSENPPSEKPARWKAPTFKVLSEAELAEKVRRSMETARRWDEIVGRTQ
jgi:hypothetical protein